MSDKIKRAFEKRPICTLYTETIINLRGYILNAPEVRFVRPQIKRHLKRLKGRFFEDLCLLSFTLMIEEACDRILRAISNHVILIAIERAELAKIVVDGLPAVAYAQIDSAITRLVADGYLQDLGGGLSFLPTPKGKAFIDISSYTHEKQLRDAEAAKQRAREARDETVFNATVESLDLARRSQELAEESLTISKESLAVSKRGVRLTGVGVFIACVAALAAILTLFQPGCSNNQASHNNTEADQNDVKPLQPEVNYPKRVVDTSKRAH